MSLFLLLHTGKLQNSDREVLDYCNIIAEKSTLDINIKPRDENWQHLCHWHTDGITIIRLQIKYER